MVSKPGTGGRAAFKEKQRKRAETSVKKFGSKSVEAKGSILRKSEGPTPTQEFTFGGKKFTSEQAVKDAIRQEIIAGLPQEQQQAIAAQPPERRVRNIQTASGGFSISGTPPEGAAGREPEVAVPPGGGDPFAPLFSGRAEAITPEDLLLTIGGFPTRLLRTGFTESLGLLETKAGKEVAEAAAGKVKTKVFELRGKKLVNVTPANTVVDKLTKSFLLRAYRGFRNPAILAGTTVSAIGSYPFAGFIKEEALQQTGLATEAAIRNRDTQGAEEALQIQEDILNPNAWDTIIASVPYANVIGSLKDFYKAAIKKLEIDKRRVEDLKAGTAGASTGNVTKDDVASPDWDRINAEREAARALERARDLALSEQISKNRLASEQAIQEAKTNAERERRESEQKFWDRQAAVIADRQAEKRRLDWEYWEKVRKAQEDNQKSNLKFGLL